MQVKRSNGSADGSEAEAKITGEAVPEEVGGFGLVAKEREPAESKRREREEESWKTRMTRSQ